MKINRLVAARATKSVVPGLVVAASLLVPGVSPVLAHPGPNSAPGPNGAPGTPPTAPPVAAFGADGSQAVDSPPTSTVVPRAGISAPLAALAPPTSQAATRNATRPSQTPAPRLGARTAPASATLLAQSSPSLGAPSSFEGIGNLAGVVPADANVAVGPSDVVELVQPYFQVFSTSGAPLTSPVTDNQLWGSLGGPCGQSPSGDFSQVLYDQLAGRWVFERPAHEPSVSGPVSLECLAVSQTADPTAAYYLYSVPVSSTQWSDYPQFGLWPNAYDIGVNLYTSSSQTTRTGDEVMTLDRADALAGAPLRMVSWVLGSQYETLVPVTLVGTLPPPSGAPSYFMAGPKDGQTTGSSLLLWAAQPNFSSPGSSTFKGPLSIPVQPYNLVICPSNPNCGVQPGTSQKLETWQDNLMWPVGYRNFGTYQSIVGSFDVAGGNNVAAMRWFEIRPSGVYQQGTYNPDGAGRYEQSIAMDRSGDLALGYTVSSSSVYPSLAYTGRVPGDPLGTLSQPEQLMWQGGGSQTGSARWGDASSLVLAPDGCTYWYANEYYPTTSAAGWHTRIGSFRFSGCVPAA